MSVFGIVIYTTYAFWLRHRIALKYVLIEHVLLPSLYWYGHSQNSQASGAELSVFIRMCSFLYGFDLQFFSLWVIVEKMTRIFDKLLFVGKGKKVYLSQSIVIVKKKKNKQPSFGTDETRVHSRNISESSVRNVNREEHKR